MSAWLVLWVRYLWPLFGYTIPSFVVPRRSQGRGQRVCVCVCVYPCLKCQEKSCVCVTQDDNQPHTCIQRHKTYSLSAPWLVHEAMSVSPAEEPQHVKQHVKQQVLWCAEVWASLWDCNLQQKLMSVAVYHCMLSWMYEPWMQLFALLLRCLTSCCCSSHLSQGGSRKLQRSSPGSSRLFQEHSVWKVTQTHTHAHTYTHAHIHTHTHTYMFYIMAKISHDFCCS